MGLVAKNDIQELTFSPGNNAYSAISLISGTYVAKYEFKEDEAEYREEVVFPNGSAVVTHELKFYLERMGNEMTPLINELIKTSDQGVVAIVVTYNGDAFLVGYSPEFGNERPLRLISVVGTTGKKLKDATGEIITLQSEDISKARAYMGDLTGIFGE